MKKSLTQHIDGYFLLTLIIILAFGTLMIYDATAVFAQGEFGGAYRLVALHIGWILAGGILFFVFSKFDYHKLKKIAFPVFLLSLFFLLLLAIAGLLFSCDTEIIFMPCYYGARRWFLLNPAPLPSIPFVGVLGFQASEFMKLCLVMYLSVLLNKNKGDSLTSFLVTAVVVGVVFLLVLAQPNMSTALLFAAIGLTIYFASGSSMLPVLIAAPPFGMFGGLFVFFSDYRRQRLLTFLGGGNEDTLASGYHIQQIMISLGSGGLFGVGIGQSIQKFNYLPEIYADSIFAVIGEELGFVGTTAFIILYAFFIYKGFDIAKKAPDLLGRLLAVGITSWIAYQFFINISAMVGLIPLTGMPLPLVSYGGSSTIFSLIALGILANVSSHRKFNV